MLGLLLLLASPWVKPALDLPPEVGRLLAEDTPGQAVAICSALPGPAARACSTPMGYGSYLIWAGARAEGVRRPADRAVPAATSGVDYINLGQGNNVDELLDRYAISTARCSM